MMTQLALLDRGRSPSWDRDFARCQRLDLGEGAWLEHQPGWLTGHQGLMDTLLRQTAWQPGQEGDPVSGQRAQLPQHGPGHPRLMDIAAALSARYGRPLRDLQLDLLRDGRDHGAAEREGVSLDQDEDGLLVLVFLGVPRPMRLRPVGKGPSRLYSPGWGDLLVLGGRGPSRWSRLSPAVRRCGGPRLTLVLRQRLAAST